MGHRYEEFDSIRGIASLSVLFHHCLIVVPIFYAAHLHQQNSDMLVNVFSNSPLHVVWAGHEAVILFFVLSGFVLSLPILNGKPLQYKSYLIKRFCRIYLPYIFVMVLSYTFYMIYKNFNLIDNFSESTSIWFNTMWSENPDFKSLISIILMLGYGTHNLNTVTWSLIHEMRISIFFPFIILFVNKKNPLKFFVIAISVLFSIWLLFMFVSNLGLSEVVSYLFYSVGYTFYYSIFFVFGGMLARYRSKLSNVFYKAKIEMKIFAILLFIFGYTIEWNTTFISYLKYSEVLNIKLLVNFLIDFTIAFSVCLLFIIVLGSGLFKSILKRQELLYLGKISFSLYLIHPISLMMLIHLFKETLNLEFLILISALLSIIFAHFLYKYIEIPTITLGKKLSKSSEKKKVA
ncbi:acyltransferase family protein [Exiguobacterium artemiae]|uniref:acyltransferase family protein n=1 Tax=Exiguobacterium artemiae TaxID=340145 RepID=UPI000479C70C|nr:acyltransferase [Exiguobacterium sibiricum]